MLVEQYGKSKKDKGKLNCPACIETPPFYFSGSNFNSK